MVRMEALTTMGSWFGSLGIRSDFLEEMTSKPSEAQ